MNKNEKEDIMAIDFREYLTLNEIPLQYQEFRQPKFRDPETGEMKQIPPPPDEDGLFIFNAETGEWEKNSINPFEDLSDEEFIDFVKGFNPHMDEYYDEDDDYYDDEDDEFLEDDIDEERLSASPFAPIRIGDYVLHLMASEDSFCSPRISSYDKYVYQQWEVMIEVKHPKWDFVVCSSEIMNELGYDAFLKDDMYIAYADVELVQKIFEHLLEKMDLYSIFDIEK